MPSFAREFTPELSEGYLASILNRRVDQQRADVGRARSEGAAAGLIGQASTGTRIASAEKSYDEGVNADIGAFNLDVAGKKREERLTDEQHSYADLERQKTEAFQRQMAELGYQFEDKEREARRKESSRFNAGGFVAGLGSSVLAAGVGGYFGGLGRAAGAASAAG